MGRIKKAAVYLLSTNFGRHTLQDFFWGGAAAATQPPFPRGCRYMPGVDRTTVLRHNGPNAIASEIVPLRVGGWRLG